MELLNKKIKPNKQTKGLCKKLFTQRKITEVSTLGSIFTSAKHNIFLMEKNTGAASPAGLKWQLHRLPLWGKNSSPYFILQ